MLSTLVSSLRDKNIEPIIRVQDDGIEVTFVCTISGDHLIKHTSNTVEDSVALCLSDIFSHFRSTKKYGKGLSGY